MNVYWCLWGKKATRTAYKIVLYCILSNFKRTKAVFSRTYMMGAKQVFKTQKGYKATEWIIVWNNQFSSVTQSCPTFCDPVNCSTPGLPVHHKLLEFTQTHAHRVGDVIQPSHPLSSPSPTPNPSQQQGLFQWVNSSHEVAKVLEFQLQHQSFQWTPRTDIL